MPLTCTARLYICVCACVCGREGGANSIFLGRWESRSESFDKPHHLHKATSQQRAQHLYQQTHTLARACRPMLQARMGSKHLAIVSTCLHVKDERAAIALARPSCSTACCSVGCRPTTAALLEVCTLAVYSARVHICTLKESNRLPQMDGLKCRLSTCCNTCASGWVNNARSTGGALPKRFLLCSRRIALGVFPRLFRFADNHLIFPLTLKASLLHPSGRVRARRQPPTSKLSNTAYPRKTHAITPPPPNHRTWGI